MQLAPKAMVWVPGQVMAGTVLSTRLTLKLHVAVLLLPSVAVSVTTVVPTPDKASPDAGNWLTAGVPQLSARLAAV